MIYFLSGGGSGGHLTPIIAVAEELRRRYPDAEIHAVVHRGDNLNSLVSENKVFSSVHPIFAGKLRRYHGQGLKGIGVLESLKNIRDLGYLGLGFFQSCYLILRFRPNAILMRGGYIGVPLGFAARLFNRPYITHDSDALASLANRLIARGARAHAVSASPEHYPYPKDKTFVTGIPLKNTFKLVDARSQSAAKQKLGLAADDKLVLITGGGLGAARLNEAAAKALNPLLQSDKRLNIIHLSGKSQVDIVKTSYSNLERVQVYGFREDIADLSAASDLVITRAGATAMAEFAVQGKPMIIVPNPMLAGGHQIHNALAYQLNGAAEIVEEQELDRKLGAAVSVLLEHAKKRESLSLKARKMSDNGATGRVVDLLIKIQRDKK
ncbi:MAG: glycosyltransferase [bacterium]|nr:glycosyltransferase [bacterium]